MVSSRILSRVLLPQIGQRIKSVFSMPITSHSGHYLFSFFPVPADPARGLYQPVPGGGVSGRYAAQ